MATLIRTLFVLGLLGAVAGAGTIFWKLEHRLPVLSYNEFMDVLANDEVAAVHLQGGEVVLTDTSGRRFASFAPDVASLLPELSRRGVAIYGRTDRPAVWWNVVGLALPLLLILLFWFVSLRRQMKEEEASHFGREKAIHFDSGVRQVTFRDVAGIPEALDELLEIVDFLQKPKKYGKLGASIPRGVLLQGPPGTGKTLLSRAIAGEAGVPFFSISGSDFVEMFVGVGASRVRDLFKEAKKNAPCIVFIDEIDAVGGRRGSGGVGGQDERGQTLNALLVEMDGFGSDDTIVVIAATNRPDILDPALRRPGRFDRQITILHPDVKGRLQILQVHTQKVRLADHVDLLHIARTTSGFSGADLANLVNEAALLAARQGKESINLTDFEAAKDRIMMGAERKGLVISDEDRRTMAYHEAGHAILAKFLPHADPLHKITIIPRGRAMGHTQQLALTDRHAYSEEYLKSRITILMGGRAAEKIALNQQTTGAQEDLLRATEIATQMVCKWGMNEAAGPLAYAKDDEGFLGTETNRRHYSEATAYLVDQEIRKLIDGCYREADRVLTEEKKFLFHLAEILLDTETLDSEEMDIIFECSRARQKEEDQTIGPEVDVVACR